MSDICQKCGYSKTLGETHKRDCLGIRWWKPKKMNFTQYYNSIIKDSEVGDYILENGTALLQHNENGLLDLVLTHSSHNRR